MMTLRDRLSPESIQLWDRLLVDLAEAGHPVASLTELRESGTRYRAAVPVLLAWLPRVTEPIFLEQLVRTLSVPWARPASAAALVQRFRDVDDPTESVRWAIGNALEVVSDDSVYDDLVELAADRRYGTARQMVVAALGRSRRPEAVDVLIGLLDDPDVSGHAVQALARQNDARARKPLQGMLSDDRAWVRKAARRAVEKLA